MKILFSSDFEGDFTRLFQYANSADICICCGDIFNYHHPPAPDFEFPLPFYSVKGNKEQWGGEKYEKMLEKVKNFFWLNDHLEKLEKITELRFYGINYLSEPVTIPNNIDVLVSHQPAYGLADQCSDPFKTKMVPHCGNKRIRKLVDRNHPNFFVAGHVHHFQKQETERTIAITLPAALTDPIVMIVEGKLSIV